MNKFRLRSTGQVVSEMEYRELHPNVSFPAVLVPDDADAILAAPPPVVGVGQRARETGIPVQDGLGNWVTGWEVITLTQEELAEEERLNNPVPTRVTRRQARQALMLNNLLDLVPGKIAAIVDPVERGMAQIEWEDSQVFERQRPLVISIGTALGLDSVGLDNLFKQAEKL